MTEKRGERDCRVVGPPMSVVIETSPTTGGGEGRSDDGLRRHSGPLSGPLHGKGS